MNYRVYAITQGPKQHFSGYYDRCPWNASQRYLAVHQIDFADRAPTAQDHITIGIIDTHDNNRFQPIAQTPAWNWQQGSLLQWDPADPENNIVYNDRRDNQFVTVIRDIHSTAERVLPRPVAAISRDGSQALSINFARLAVDRPGYGYEGIPDPYADQLAPDQDGIYHIDMQTGKYQLIISLAQLAARQASPDMTSKKHRVNHLLFSPRDQRFLFLHRWQGPDMKATTHLYTANPDGSDLYLLNPDDMTSHCDWRDDDHVIAFARQFSLGDNYYLFTDKTDHVELIGKEKLTSYPAGFSRYGMDGHCSYSPDRQWICTDTYPDDDDNRRLLLYHPATDRRVDLGRYYERPWARDDARCDMHPSWSRDGKMICFDSFYTGTRQTYIADVSNIVTS